MTPLVSVCVLTWNHEKYILQCLESIFNQDYQNLEIIFLDNCSTDETFKLASTALENCSVPNTIIQNSSPEKTSRNCNTMLQNAKGEFICLISGDDWMAEKNISSKIEKMMSDSQLAAVYSEVYSYIDPENRTVKKKGERRYEGWVFDELVNGNFIVAPGILLDATKIREVGGFNEETAIEDWDLWLRLSQRYKIGFVDKFLVYYRRHSSNVSSSHNTAYIESMLQIIEQYRHHKNYRYCKQKIVYQQFKNLTEATPGLKNVWCSLRIQDGTVFRLNILKHNIVKLIKS